MSAEPKPRKWSVALVPAAIVAALLAFATAASAARDPIASGTADLHMKKGFLRKIANLGVTVQPLGNGAVDGNKIGLQVGSGKLDPVAVEGFLESGGGFKLMRGQRGVPITRLTLNTVKGAAYATIAKAHMQLGTLSAPLYAGREGFGTHFKAIKLILTEKAARRISNRLGLRGHQRLNPERTLSNAYTTAHPETVTVLPQGAAVLSGDAATLAKFAQKGVKVPQGFTALAPAAPAGPASFQLPIAGGTIAPDASKGTVGTAGGVQILKQAEPFSPTLRLRNAEIDFGARTASAELEVLPAPPFAGAAGRSTIVDIALPANSVSVDPGARTIAIKGAEARLQAAAASTLNDVFNQPAPEPPPSSNFVVGDRLGTISMTLQAQ